MHTFYRHCIALSALLVATFLSFISYAHPNNFKVDSINALVQKLSSDTDKIKTFISIASGMSCEDSNNKIIVANEAKKLAEKIKWRQGIYKANRKLGEIYFSCQKNYFKAFEAFEDNVKLANNYKDTLNAAIALETIAKAYQKLGQYQKALEYYNKVLITTTNPDMQMGVLGDMGVVYSEIGDYSNALSSYRSSLAVLDSAAKLKNNIADLQDTLQTAGLQLNIGDTYLAMSQPDKAINNYEKVLVLSAAIKDMYFQIAGATGIGKTFKLKNNFQKAIEYYNNALNECREINDFEDEVKILNELANTYLETNEFPRAMAYADSALRLAEEQHYIYLPSKSFTTLGNIYLKQKKYDDAVSVLKKALDISQKNNLLEDERDAWFALSNAFEGKGQLKESKDAFMHYYATRDSMSNIEKENLVMRKELESDYRSKKIIDSVNRENEYERTIASNRSYTYIGFTGLLLGSFLIFFIFRNYNTKKKYNELLSDRKN